MWTRFQTWLNSVALLGYLWASMIAPYHAQVGCGCSKKSCQHSARSQGRLTHSLQDAVAPLGDRNAAGDLVAIQFAAESSDADDWVEHDREACDADDLIAANDGGACEDPECACRDCRSQLVRDCGDVACAHGPCSHDAAPHGSLPHDSHNCSLCQFLVHPCMIAVALEPPPPLGCISILPAVAVVEAPCSPAIVISARGPPC